MIDWTDEFKNKSDKRLLEIQKSFDDELISMEELKDFLSKGYEIVDTDKIEKSIKDTSQLIKKEVWVVRKNGTSFKQTVWVKPITEEKTETPVGEEVSPEVRGMQIEKYSDKSILIKGDTYTNLDLMKTIKSELNNGVYNSKLKGWIFSFKFVDKVLGMLWSGIEDEDKKKAIQNQKNASLSEGDSVDINGQKGTVKENVSNNLGIKYNIELEDGTLLEEVDEKVLEVQPETDDTKIKDTINNASPENRAKTEKKLYGIKPITDIHNYSLEEYMKMHGLSDEDIQGAIKMLTPKEKTGKTRTPSSSPSKKSTTDQKEGLTKRQLIFKLIHAHYQATKAAVEAGLDVPDKVLALYDDLKEMQAKNKKELSDEHKRKISEALKKNKAEEEKETKSKDVKSEELDRSNYQPKDGETFMFASKEDPRVNVSIKTKDYTDIRALDIVIPKQKDILTKEKPYFIPDINLKKFANNSYTISSIKLDDDKYLVALDGHTVTENYTTKTNKDGRFAVMTLDNLTATQSYYQLKAKEELRAYEMNRMLSARERYSEAIQNTRGISKEEADKEAEKYYKKPKASRLKVLSDNKVTYDQMFMIQGYLQAKKEKADRADVFKMYNSQRSEIQQKSLDLELQREHDESSFTKGRETSYGNIGVKNDLLDEFGVKIKRQNGDEINEKETKQIKDALISISNVFGKNINMNKEFDLKISHAGDVKQHASKATGIFFPHYGAIGVSNEYGGDMFNFVFAHEYAHFSDYWVGKKTGNHYASDKQGSTANEIAKVFRSNLNKKSSSGYINRTCENFARAMEQHTAITLKGDDAIVWDESKYFEHENYVSKDVYETKIKPLIKQFLEENKDILKSIENTLFN